MTIDQRVWIALHAEALLLSTLAVVAVLIIAIAAVEAEASRRIRQLESQLQDARSVVEKYDGIDEVTLDTLYAIRRAAQRR